MDDSANQTNTSGGAYIEGNVSAGQQLIGRDSITFNIISADPKELIQSFLASPLKNRSDQWMTELGQTIADLHKHTGITLEELQGNDVFIDTVLRASQLALKTSQKEKLDALRNAITNSVLSDAPDEIFQHMFLNFIDEFSPWHLRILKLLSSSGKASLIRQDYYQKNFSDKESIPADRILGGPGKLNTDAQDVTKEHYPEIDSYVSILVEDLISYKLIRDDMLTTVSEGLSKMISIKTVFAGDRVRNPDDWSVHDQSHIEWGEVKLEAFKWELIRWTTDLGEQFLKFIEDPF